MEAAHQESTPRSTGRRRLLTARPSVSPKDIQETEKLIVKAEQMVDAVVDKHTHQATRRKHASSKADLESAELEAKVAKYRQDLVDKEAALPPKSLIGKGLAEQRIEQRVKDYESCLQRKMIEELVQQATQASPRSASPQVYTAIGTSHSSPETQQTLSPPNVNMVALSTGLTIPIVLSASGFAHFPRHWDDDDEWERVSSQHSDDPEDKKWDHVSQHSHSGSDGDDKKWEHLSQGSVAGGDDKKKEPSPKKCRVASWFGK